MTMMIGYAVPRTPSVDTYIILLHFPKPLFPYVKSTLKWRARRIDLTLVLGILPQTIPLRC